MSRRTHARRLPAADDRLERSIGRTAGAGVLMVAFLLTVGLALWVLNLEPRTSDRLLHAGLITLLLTPVLGLIVSVKAFAHERDWFFTCVALGVLTVLAGSFWMALQQ